MDVRDLAFPTGFRLEHGETVLEGPRLERAVATATAALLKAGLQRHEPVVFQAADDLPSILALLAIRRAGGTSVPLHPRLAPPEAAALIARVGPRLVVGPGAGPFPGIDGSWDVAPLSGPPRALPAQFVVFTSGTEGRPKGVLLGEGAFRAHAHAAAQRLSLRNDDRWLLSLSVAHVGGLAMLLRAVQLGNALVLPADASDLDGETRRHATTHVSVVPTQLARWVEAARGAAPPTLRCVLVGGAPLDPALLERARHVGFPVRATYGLSEAASQVATQAVEDPPTSCGKPLPGVTVRIEDEAGTPVGAGLAGRICVRGATLFVGYLDDDATTKEVLRGGWLRTGDRGHVDGAGHLFVAGRGDDVIVSGGEKIDPTEVEAVLLLHPMVADACVVGVPDPEWGQAVVAAVVPRGGATPTAAELREHCARSLARYKCPKRVEVVAAIPRTLTGKARRSQVRAALTRP